MKKWTRVAYREICGACGTLLSANTPVMEVSLPSVKKPKYRCEECVGAAPPDLPERIDLQESIETKVSRLRDMAIQARREWMQHNND